MNVTCQACRTVYRVDPRKIPDRGVRARCARCPSEIRIDAEEVAHYLEGHSPGGDDSVVSGGAFIASEAEETGGEADASAPHPQEGWVDEGGWRRESDDLDEPAQANAGHTAAADFEESERHDREWNSVPAEDVDLHDGFSDSDQAYREGDVAPVEGLQTDPMGEVGERTVSDSDGASGQDHERDGHVFAEDSSGSSFSEGSGSDASTSATSVGDAETDSWSGEDRPSEPDHYEASHEGEGSPSPEEDDRIEIVGTEYGIDSSAAVQSDDPPRAAEDDGDVISSDSDEPTDVEVEDRMEASPPVDDAASESREPPVPVEVHQAREAESLTGFAESSRPSYAEPDLPPPPFGSSDPHVRAKRLARALVSDIVVYHPDRRDRSLREGTLRQEFREEIRKSWDEYVGHVGDQIARDTSYFRDALNELLAGGAQLF
jgi:predicted Zn finger-like uncharacterized protein